MRREGVRKGGTFREMAGASAGPPPPADAERASLTVLDPEGMGCETVPWILRALHRLDDSVWVEHRGAGSLQVAERGRGTPGRRLMWTRFYAGEELTVAATGPDAGEALSACVEMAAVPPEERKALYRERYSRRRQARPCPVCERPDVELVDEALEEGRSPRSIRADYPGVSRVEIAAHAKDCQPTDERGKA